MIEWTGEKFERDNNLPKYHLWPTLLAILIRLLASKIKLTSVHMVRDMRKNIVMPIPMHVK